MDLRKQGEAQAVCGTAQVERETTQAVCETGQAAGETTQAACETTQAAGETTQAACEVKQPEHAEGTVQKNNVLENTMVGIGSLVTYLVVSAVKSFALFLKKIFLIPVRGAKPLCRELLRYAARRLARTKRVFARKTAEVRTLRKNFSERKAEAGLGTAFSMLRSDMKDSSRNRKKALCTLVNYAVPAVCLVFLINVVSDKAAADYGVTVEYNGQELGLVSEEAVLDSAQEVIADRAAYYDTGSGTYITATLSLKPVGAGDTVITEELTMAEVLQEQVVQLPEEPAGSEAQTEAGAEASAEEIPVAAGGAVDSAAADEAIGRETVPEDNRVRAYVVTVDGEVIGAVQENSEIDEYIEGLKEEYNGEDIVDVSLDKDIEYTYEQYVDPEDIVSQKDIVEKLSSNVTEPVYYEIQEGDIPWNIAHDNDMTVDELKECTVTYKGRQIDDITEECPIGAMVQLSEEVPYLNVLTTREVEYTEVIDYEIVYTDDPDMYKGDSAVDVAGVEGEKRVKALVTYSGDTRVSKEVIEETVVSEPVTKYMRVGTRETTTPVSTGSGGSGDYFWPVDGGYISAYQGDGRGHKGIDIAAPYGTPIYAAESGTVTETGGGWNGGYGNCVKIQHDDGNVTVYAHQSSIAVSYGDYVVKGQLIGYVGSTGDSTGNHLHFEVRSNGTYANPVNYVSQY